MDSRHFKKCCASDVLILKNAYAALTPQLMQEAFSVSIPAAEVAAASDLVLRDFAGQPWYRDDTSNSIALAVLERTPNYANVADANGRLIVSSSECISASGHTLSRQPTQQLIEDFEFGIVYFYSTMRVIACEDDDQE